MKRVESVLQLDLPGVLDKYKAAGDIVSSTLREICGKCIVGVKIIDLCSEGDKILLDKLDKLYRGVKKGTSMPTCITRNNITGYNSPLIGDSEILVDGDIVKIELGVHIDEYPVLIGTTIYIGDVIEDPKICATVRAISEASKNILQYMRVGFDNIKIQNTMEDAAKKYNCNLLLVDNTGIMAPGIMSYQVSRGIINGHNDDDDDVHRMILSRHHDNYEFTQVSTPFEENEIYVIDLAISSGSGKLTQTDKYTTIYQRIDDVTQNLKLKTARASLVKYDNFPKNIRDFYDVKMKLGTNICVKEGLVRPYPILQERVGEYIAQAKFTVIVRKGKHILLSGMTMDNTIKKCKN